MGRIRSIHPDILTDPDFAAVHRDGRLLFVYSLIVADDAGNLEDSPRALKMACFPGDDDLPVARIEELRNALLSGRFYEPYEADGKRYLHIRNFAKYQKPDHPTKPKFPLSPGQSFTYHARQGNTYIQKTEQGPSPEPKANVPRTLPERDANVLAGEERSGTGLERRGTEVDLEGRGEDGKATGREGGRALPSPPSGGGRAAALQKNNESNSKATSSDKGNEADFPDYVVADIIRHSPETRETILITVNDYKSGTIPREEADATVAPFKLSRRTIDALFPIRGG